MMEELYKVMDDLLDVEFQMKSGIDLLKELEEFFYRLGLKDGLNLKNTVKLVLEMIS